MLNGVVKLCYKEEGLQLQADSVTEAAIAGKSCGVRLVQVRLEEVRLEECGEI